jgi:hypothetical protein
MVWSIGSTWPIAKIRPVNRDRLIIRTEPLLQWAISRRVEIELSAGNNKTSGPCPLQSAASSIDMPSHCHASFSVCIGRKFLSFRRW